MMGGRDAFSRVAMCGAVSDLASFLRLLESLGLSLFELAIDDLRAFGPLAHTKHVHGGGELEVTDATNSSEQRQVSIAAMQSHPAAERSTTRAY